MPFRETDVKEGMIAWFKINNLRADDSNINHSGGEKESEEKHKNESGRPFVCYKVDGDLCFWSPLTKIEPGEESKLNSERLEIERGWVKEHLKSRTPFFKSEGSKVYLNHGNHLYEGSKSDFSSISYNSKYINEAGYEKYVDTIGAKNVLNGEEPYQAFRPYIIDLTAIIAEIISQVEHRDCEINDGYKKSFDEIKEKSTATT